MVVEDIGKVKRNRIQRQPAEIEIDLGGIAAKTQINGWECAHHRLLEIHYQQGRGCIIPTSGPIQHKDIIVTNAPTSQHINN